MVGKQIHHYKILEKLGAGGMGEVYLAEDTRLNRKVALKFLTDAVAGDQTFLKRFRREAQAIASLKHENIVGVHELGESEGRQYICLEYIEGASLRDFIQKDSLSLRDVLRVTIQICRGLGAAHEKGVQHRDIKPENILIDDHSTVKILDFGLARIEGASRVTKTHTTLGTLQYSSPEQVCGELTDSRSDLFSLGVVMYEMVTGRLPFTVNMTLQSCTPSPMKPRSPLRDTNQTSRMSSN